MPRCRFGRARATVQSSIALLGAFPGGDPVKSHSTAVPRRIVFAQTAELRNRRARSFVARFPLRAWVRCRRCGEAAAQTTPRVAQSRDPPTKMIRPQCSRGAPAMALNCRRSHKSQGDCVARSSVKRTSLRPHDPTSVRRSFEFVREHASSTRILQCPNPRPP